MRLDVLQSRELTAVLLAIKSLDKTTRKMIRRETKRIADPEWRKSLAQHADTRLEHRVIVDTAVIAVSDQNVRIKSASKGRPLSGGLDPKTDFHAIEFGVDRNRKTTYIRNRKGTVHRVTRRVGGALKARRWPTGYVFFPTARKFIPRMGSLWVQTTVRTIANALEGKQE